MITYKIGYVSSFDRMTCRGVMRCENEEIGFHSTTFDSGRPTRFPRVGERVKVTYGDGCLIRIRPQK